MLAGTIAAGIQGYQAGTNLKEDRKVKQQRLTQEADLHQQKLDSYGRTKTAQEQQIEQQSLALQQMRKTMLKATGKEAMLSLYGKNTASFNQALQDPEVRKLFNNYTNVEYKEDGYYGTKARPDGTTTQERIQPQTLNMWSIRTGAQEVLDQQAQLKFERQKQEADLTKTQISTTKAIEQINKIRAEIEQIELGKPQGRRDSLTQFEDYIQKAYPEATPEEVVGLYQQYATKQLAGKSEVKEGLDIKDLSSNQAAGEALFTEKVFDKQKAREIENSNYANMDSGQKALLKKDIENYKSRYLVSENLDRLLNTSGLEVDLDAKETLAANMGKLFGDESEKLMKYIDFKTRTGIILANFMKEMSGTAVADAEVARLKEIMLSGEYSDEASVLQAMKSFVSELRDQNKTSGEKLRATVPYTIYNYSKQDTKKVSAADFD